MFVHPVPVERWMGEVYVADESVLLYDLIQKDLEK
jgi:hypothetical protein